MRDGYNEEILSLVLTENDQDERDSNDAVHDEILCPDPGLTTATGKNNINKKKVKITIIIIKKKIIQ